MVLGNFPTIRIWGNSLLKNQIVLISDFIFITGIFMQIENWKFRIKTGSAGFKLKKVVKRVI